MLVTTVEDPFVVAFRGRFSGVLHWRDLDAFWEVARNKAGAGWYLYAIGEPVPMQVATAEEVNLFIGEVDAVLRRDHDEDYCGIVYVDSVTEPTMIKIFDPHNLGSQCGFSEHPPSPGWVMSLLPPTDLCDARPLPGNRKRWWRRMWGARG